MAEQLTFMYGGFDDTVHIPKNEYNELLKDSKLLAALEAAGVENWEGWTDALALLGN